MAVARPCLVLACVFGCKFSPPSGGPIDAADAMPDVPPDVPDAAPDVCMMWDPEHFDPCMVGGPQDPPPFDTAASPYTYDTTTSGGVLKDKNGLVVSMSDDVVMQPDNSAVALWNLSSLTLPQNVVINIIGTKPLIIASWDTMQIDGVLDAGSHTDEIDAAAGIDATVQLGAGASSASCTLLAGGPGADGVSTGGSGGGGGAGFYGTGAVGSIGDSGSGNTAGGSAGMALTPTVIRAGCAGGASGKAGAGAVVSPATSESLANPGSGTQPSSSAINAIQPLRSAVMRGSGSACLPHAHVLRNHSVGRMWSGAGSGPRLCAVIRIAMSSSLAFAYSMRMSK